MSDLDKNGESRGFKGLHSLSPKVSDSNLDIDISSDKKSLDNSSSTSANSGTSSVSNSVPQKSQTAPPESRPFVFLGLIALAALFLFIVFSDSSEQSATEAAPPAAYATAEPDFAAPPEAAADITPQPSFAASEPDYAAPPEELMIPESMPTAESKPPVGTNNIFSSNEIRYCVFEDMRINGAKAVVDNYSESSVNTFNSMVEDYNSRCSFFRYRDGALEPIKQQAYRLQSQLENEGRMRMGM